MARISDILKFSRSILLEGIQVKDLKRLFPDNQDFGKACDMYAARIKNDNEAKNKFSLVDLDPYKKNPQGFIDAVKNALSFIEERKSQKNGRKVNRKIQQLPKGVNLVYSSPNCVIVSPESPVFSRDAAYLDGGSATWCIASPSDNACPYWKMYDAQFVVYVYDTANDLSWAIVVSGKDLANIQNPQFNASNYVYFQVEARENNTMGEEGKKRRVFTDMLESIGMSNADFCGIVNRYVLNKYNEKMSFLRKASVQEILEEAKIKKNSDLILLKVKDVALPKEDAQYIFEEVFCGDGIDSKLKMYGLSFEVRNEIATALVLSHKLDVKRLYTYGTPDERVNLLSIVSSMGLNNRGAIIRGLLEQGADIFQPIKRVRYTFKGEVIENTTYFEVAIENEESAVLNVIFEYATDADKPSVWGDKFTKQEVAFIRAFMPQVNFRLEDKTGENCFESFDQDVIQSVFNKLMAVNAAEIINVYKNFNRIFLTNKASNQNIIYVLNMFVKSNKIDINAMYGINDKFTLAFFLYLTDASHSQYIRVGELIEKGFDFSIPSVVINPNSGEKETATVADIAYAKADNATVYLLMKKANVLPEGFDEKTTESFSQDFAIETINEALSTLFNSEGEVYYPSKGKCEMIKESIRIIKDGVYDGKIDQYETHFDFTTAYGDKKERQMGLMEGLVHVFEYLRYDNEHMESEIRDLLRKEFDPAYSLYEDMSVIVRGTETYVNKNQNPQENANETNFVTSGFSTELFKEILEAGEGAWTDEMWKKAYHNVCWNYCSRVGIFKALIEAAPFDLVNSLNEKGRTELTQELVTAFGLASNDDVKMLRVKRFNQKRAEQLLKFVDIQLSHGADINAGNPNDSFGKAKYIIGLLKYDDYFIPKNPIAAETAKKIIEKLSEKL